MTREAIDCVVTEYVTEINRTVTCLHWNEETSGDIIVIYLQQ